MISQEKLIHIVGVENVSQDSEALESYSRDISFVNPIKPRYIIKPQNKKAIQELVIMANETRTPLIPVSSGPPHFRGDTVPSTPGAIIVDLSDMKKILNVDRPQYTASYSKLITRVQGGVK